MCADKNNQVTDIELTCDTHLFMIFIGPNVDLFSGYRTRTSN